MANLDVQALQEQSWDPQEAHDNYCQYWRWCEPPMLVKAWKSSLPLIGRYYRLQSRNPRDTFSGDDLVAGMAWNLYDRLRRRKIPRMASRKDHCNYLWRCCSNWFADATKEMSRGAHDVPPDWAPRLHPECEEWYSEWRLFKSELPSAIEKRIRTLNPWGFSPRFREAVGYIVNAVLADEEPRLSEIRRIAGRKFDPHDVRTRAYHQIWKFLGGIEIGANRSWFETQGSDSSGPVGVGA